MLPLTSDVTNLIALTATAVVIGLVAVFTIQFITQFARSVLDNL